MSSRWYLPYVGVICAGVLFILLSTYGFHSLSGTPGLGAALGRFALGIFLLVGVSAVIVSGIDMYRHRPSEE